MRPSFLRYCLSLVPECSGILLCLGFFLLGGCAAQSEATPATTQTAHKAAQTPAASAETLPEIWQALGKRLTADNLYAADLDDIFRRLDTPSQDPMGRKVQELYRNAFTPPSPPPPPGTPAKTPRYINTNVVNEGNAALCRQFLIDNEQPFARAETLYGVPRDIAVSLLFVETRLGEYLGKNDVFYTLASMASSRHPDQIPLWLEQLENPEGRLDWIQERMEQRSDWAYKELTAFIRYARANNFQLLSVPGSVYGAMGLCQFMPSNLLPYGADGNGDSVINLFIADDAIASLCNYLAQNGWKPGLSRADRHAALKRYNRLNIYANNILCLADLVRGEAIGKPVIPGQPSKSAAKKAKKKPAKGATKSPAKSTTKKK